MFPQLPPRTPAQKHLWLAPYIAVGIFGITMLILTALLQWREESTARSALEGDLHWAERTIEARLRAHQDFLGELARAQEFRQLTYETFQVRASHYVLDSPEISTLLWVSPEGKVEWVSPHESTVTFVGDELDPERQGALQQAMRRLTAIFSAPYRDRDQRPNNDLIVPVRQGSSDIGAFVAPLSMEALLRNVLPTSFRARYSLSLRDENDHEIFSNSTTPPSDRSLIGTIALDLPGRRLTLNVTAYRGGEFWLRYAPATLIILLTLIATITLVALRRHARHRAAAEDALRSAYAFRQAMSQSLITGLRAVDLQGRITFVNAAFCRMTGFDETELLGQAPPYPYWPPEEFAQLQFNIDEALAGRAPSNGFEMRIMRKNGERFDVRLYFSPLIDGDGRQLGWMASMNDITEPKRARVELEQAHQRFVTVLDGLDAAVHVTDVETGEILFANRTFQHIFGFDAVGRASAQITASCRPADHQLQRNPSQLASHELPCELFDGEIQHARSGRWYHIHEQAIRWVDGRTVRVQIAADITERKHIDDVNLQQQKRLEQTSRLITMGEMASSLAHELNQPLSAIANYCAGCIRRMESGNYRMDDLLAAMQKAASQAERAGTIIRRMRDMVKKSEPRRENIALARTIEEMRAFADIDAQRTGTRIELDIPENLPEIHVDRILIEQVLLNLVRNGIEAMQAVPFEHRVVRITASCSDERQVEIAVSDGGHGLADTDLERIFTPFYTTKPDGMGIGLAICRSIIEFHQGRLWAEPRSEGGTTFRFTVPVEEHDD